MVKKVLFVTAALLVAIAMAGTKGLNFNQGSHQAMAQDKITKEKAGKIATDKYGGDVINVEKEHEDGNLVYEVEIKNSKQGRIEVDVDANDGHIVGMEKEDSDEDEGDNGNQNEGNTGNGNNGSNNGSENGNNNGSNMISKQKAGQIATNKYGGDIINVEKEQENGSPVYEVEIKNSNQGRIEVDVDVYSGKIVGMEKENNDNNKEDNNQNNNQGQNGMNQNNNDNGQSGTTNQGGGEMPQTSSNTPLGMMIGLLMVLSGGALWFVRNRRRHQSSRK